MSLDREPIVLEGHSAVILSMACSASGDVATGSLDCTVRLWRDGRCLRSFLGHGDAVRALAISDDLLASSSGVTARAAELKVERLGFAKVWSLETGSCDSFGSHEGSIHTMQRLSGETG